MKVTVRKLCCAAVLLLAVCAIPVSGRADGHAPNSARNARTLILYFENDLFGGTDQYYTNAVRVTAISPDLVNWAESRDLPDMLDNAIMSLPFAGDDDALYNVSLSLGQSIYTPSDTQARGLQEDDRPYAGFLYGAVGLHAKKGRRLDTLEFTLGVVGPYALGETAQNEVHSLRHLKTAKGWDNQLHNEPGLMVAWERTFRMNKELGTGWDWDALPHFGATAGNVMTYANAGGELRFGWNLPSDFGTSLIRAGGGVGAPTSDDDPRVNGDFGFYFFLGTDVRGVARNIFLDGNTFVQSHHVEKKNLVADINGGIAFIIGGWRIAYTHVVRTEEFVEQDKEQHFGSLQLSYSF
ncbi:lipid A deacylase LpxR family protein [Desulfovibrio mangrovi]|uniref:lipid A deacylase LpxR family protein n=1 Tax=Desulfovibrio mangrovi TaxID=2976983 RepID=UPI002246E430|nr:lipid A deacylase LpxR family protein [Desulfovibrio mangrovi]UZP65915.1 lipid A deacylase LpxR family protein [Desulfovibrio mangrovi]